MLFDLNVYVSLFKLEKSSVNVNVLTYRCIREVGADNQRTEQKYWLVLTATASPTPLT